MLGHILLTAVNAVAPIILLIALGYFLRQIKFLTDEFIKIGNKLVFNICIPVMLFVNVYDVESITDIRWDVVLYCLVIVTLLFGLGWLQGKVLTNDPRRRGVLWQSAFLQQRAGLYRRLITRMTRGCVAMTFMRGFHLHMRYTKGMPSVAVWRTQWISTICW